MTSAPESSSSVYRQRGWRMSPGVERVYVNAWARDELGWRPVGDFGRVLECLAYGEEPRSELARAVGSKGYHPGARCPSCRKTARASRSATP